MRSPWQLGASADEPASRNAIVEVAQDALPGFDQIGISLMDRKGNVETKAATGDLVWTLDKLQYELGEGPCVETLHDRTIVEAPDVRHDQRWPRYVPRAVAEGLKAQLALKLYLDDESTTARVKQLCVAE